MANRIVITDMPCLDVQIWDVGQVGDYTQVSGRQGHLTLSGFITSPAMPMLRLAARRGPAHWHQKKGR
jgi:hypothetical protein